MPLIRAFDTPLQPLHSPIEHHSMIININNEESIRSPVSQLKPLEGAVHTDSEGSAIHLTLTAILSTSSQSTSSDARIIKWLSNLSPDPSELPSPAISGPLTPSINEILLSALEPSPEESAYDDTSSVLKVGKPKGRPLTSALPSIGNQFSQKFTSASFDKEPLFTPHLNVPRPHCSSFFISPVTLPFQTEIDELESELESLPGAVFTMPSDSNSGEERSNNDLSSSFNPNENVALLPTPSLKHSSDLSSTSGVSPFLMEHVIPVECGDLAGTELNDGTTSRIVAHLERERRRRTEDGLGVRLHQISSEAEQTQKGMSSNRYREIAMWLLTVPPPRRTSELVDPLQSFRETRFHAVQLFSRYCFHMGWFHFLNNAHSHDISPLYEVEFVDDREHAMWDAALGCLAWAVRIHHDYTKPNYRVPVKEFLYIAHYPLTRSKYHLLCDMVLVQLNYAIMDVTPHAYLLDVYGACRSLQDILRYEDSWRRLQQLVLGLLYLGVSDISFICFPISVLTIAALAESVRDLVTIENAEQVTKTVSELPRVDTSSLSPYYPSSRASIYTCSTPHQLKYIKRAAIDSVCEQIEEELTTTDFKVERAIEDMRTLFEVQPADLTACVKWLSNLRSF